MKELLTVAIFSIKDMIRRKSFIVSNIIIILMIIIGTNIPNIINAFFGADDIFANKILVVDNDNVFEGTLASLNNLASNTSAEDNMTNSSEMPFKTEFIIANEPISFEEIKNKITAKDITSALIISKTGNIIDLEYVVENIATLTSTPENYINSLNVLYTNLQLSKLNLSNEQLQSLTPNFEFKISQTTEQEVGGDVVAIMLLSLVLFMAIYFFAYQVSTSITTEKTSKIMETLVTSTTPKTIVLGKTIGIGIVGLLQTTILVAIALVSAYTFTGEEILSQLFDLNQITPFLALITIIYFILGYMMYALMYALTGSTVSKPEDVQSANGPVGILAIVGFYLAYFTMMNPTSNLNVFASIFPLSSPFCMPFRVMMGIATTGEIISSIFFLIITSAIIAYISIKIYSQAILNYGNKLGLKDIKNMFKTK